MTYDLNGKQIRTSEIVLFLYLAISVWGLRSEDSSNVYLYLISAVVLVYTGTIVLLAKNPEVNLPCKSNRIVMRVFLLTYLYGVIGGILNGNEIRYILRNNSGMLIYLWAYVIANLRISEVLIKKVIKYVGVALTIVTPIIYIILFVIHLGVWNIVLAVPLLNSFQTGIQEWGFTLEYAGIVMLYAGYAYAVYEVMYYSKFRYIVLMAIEALLICLLTLSGGRVLELAVLTLLEVMALAKSKANRNNRIIIILMITVVIFMLPLFASFIFDPNDGGNQRRITQIQYITENFNVFGHGLGATYREIGQLYGIETIYLDMFYKFGIFVIPVFISYIITYIECFILLSKTDGDWIDAMPLVFMGYLWYSFGNPNLFSVGNVLMHIVALEIISKRRVERIKNENNPGWDKFWQLREKNS